MFLFLLENIWLINHYSYFSKNLLCVLSVSEVSVGENMHEVTEILSSSGTQMIITELTKGLPRASPQPHEYSHLSYFIFKILCNTFLSSTYRVDLCSGNTLDKRCPTRMCFIYIVKLHFLRG